LKNTYNEKFYDSQSETSRSSASIVVPLIMELLNPGSVVDIGCGIGTWLSVFKQLGVENILGIDGDYVNRGRLQFSKEQFIPLDLSTLNDPISTINLNFDLAVSLEVAEHISEDHADIFVKFITSLSQIVFFSAAIPGQGGANHINEQWPDYWHGKFENYGYIPFDVIRRCLWEETEVEPWYIQNSFIYVHKSNIELSKKLNMRITNLPTRIIHPELMRRFVSLEYIESTTMFNELIRRVKNKIFR